MVTEKEMGIICFDFDGVIHSYSSGWLGIDILPDEPVEGIKEEIQRIRDSGYKVHVFSARCREGKGVAAIIEYLDKHNIIVDEVSKNKPPAIVSVDDRVICFNGKVEGLKEKIDNFVPWTEGVSTDEVQILETWIDDLHFGMYLNCVFCGKRFQESSRADMEKHIIDCQKHPMFKLNKHYQELFKIYIGQQEELKSIKDKEGE